MIGRVNMHASKPPRGGNNKIRSFGLMAITLGSALYTASLSADTYLLPAEGNTVIGAVGLIEAIHEDTLPDLAYVYDQGFQEMKLANPRVDTWIPREGTEVVVPSFYVLPDTPREGIVINVPEMRLYYFPKPKEGEAAVVVTYPISIGRQDWTTPLGLAKVTGKVKDPTWNPPESIRQEHAAQGDILPKVVLPGPDNPLGAYALYLNRKGYLIHGTDKPYGIGMRVTHGCIRLYPKDIEQLFAEVEVGTPVNIVNQPFKAGWLNGVLYLETHPYLEEHGEAFADSFTQVVGQVTLATQDNQVEVDWDRVQKVVSERTGIPSAISKSSPRNFSNTPADPDLLLVDEVLAEPAEPRQWVESLPGS